MFFIEIEISLYITSAGVCPFEDWLSSLRDTHTKRKVLTRIARLRLGNYGDWKIVGAGVKELRINWGPGYRIYFGEERKNIIILLIGGNKRSQDRDIKYARKYWHDYKEKKKHKKY